MCVCGGGGGVGMRECAKDTPSPTDKNKSAHDDAHLAGAYSYRGWSGQRSTSRGTRDNR